jgi:hypothetical protein
MARVQRRSGELALVALVALTAPAAVDAVETFEYLYIEANEGGSSGGHTAIRFGDRVYHFQNRDGQLAILREDAREFFHAYALLSNRTIHARTIAVEPEVRARLRAHFNRRHHAEDRQRDVAAALAEDRRFLERWLELSGDAAASLAVPGAGYFFPARPGEEEPALVRLRAQLQDRVGPGFAAERRAAGHRALLRIAAEDPAGWPASPPVDPWHEPEFSAPFARRYRAAAADLAALDVLENARPLRRELVVAPSEPIYRLTLDERASLRVFAAGLEDELVRLAVSGREGWGRPLLVGMARLAALDHSLRTGTLVFLDSYAEHAGVIEGRSLRERHDLAPAMLAEARAQLEDSRSDFFSSDHPGEREWARLEQTANRAQELAQAFSRGGGDLRLQRGHLVPTRAAPYPALVPYPGAPETLRASLARVRARERAYDAALDDLYAYHLITHNCVSELFVTLNAALGGEPGASERALGGFIDGRASLGFIPFVSAGAVETHYRVVDRRVTPSYREARIHAMKQRESPVLVSLREASTLTARSYQRGHRDSFFVFFTDDVILLRPPLGAVNLVAAVAESLWGLAMLPLDRGRTVLSGLEGALVSLPELVFQNIRKGSNDWVPRAAQLPPVTSNSGCSGPTSRPRFGSLISC